MRILEAVSGTGIDGACIHVVQLARELTTRGHAVQVACRPGSWIERELRGSPVGIVPSDLHRWPTDELKRIATIVREQDIDVVHTHMSRAHFFGVLLRCFSDVPVVATAHSHRVQPHWMFNDAVIAVSGSVARFQRTFNRVRRARLHVVHPFVDTNRFAPLSDTERQLMRATLGLAPSAIVVGMVGNIYLRKGVVAFVRLFADIHRAVPDARLLVVGGGPVDHLAEAKAESERCGVAERISWTGHVAEIPKIMGALDVLVVNSPDESFSVVTAEAMACGVPVVARDVGGIAESVIDGATGFVVPIRDDRRFVERIVSLLQSPELRAQYGAAGRARAQQHFAVNAQVHKIEAVLAATRRHRGHQRRGTGAGV